ncbi:hypothetical protein BTO30_10655 [Domibacillus antri]|uniref:Uncharacterized protein n=1 Tax=Domibacillus antri TaxID=1714264 RepID=A0A1Q8Q4J8_9BACI|nr:hypothetical protein [Domibacillus antri]OLN22201.1 hypothetical protein BTO30_10655 [Domibacillus antri]
MKKNKWVHYIMTGALSLGVLGTASLPALAAASETALDSETKKKVQTVMDTLRTKLADIGVDLPEKKEKGDLFANLDEETKAKAEAIMENLHNGTITHDEGKEQLAALGLELPERGGHRNHGGKGDFLAGLDEETKAKAEAILEQKREGTITEEEAAAQLEAIGVTLPERVDPFADLDDETKAKAEAIMEQHREGSLTHEEVDEQLAAIGVERLERGGKRGREGDILKGLDDETKAEAEALLDEAEAELEALGVEKVPFR